VDVELIDMLGASRDEVLQKSSEALRRARLAHYEESGSEESERRLKDLFDLVFQSLDKRDLGPMCRYAESVAEQRFGAGFDIAEVQTGFNVLEEAIWHLVIARLPTDDLVEATGLIGTILGAGKGELARKWVSLATSRHVPSLDLTALFEGTGS
jgi:hypothetical protein